MTLRRAEIEQTLAESRLKTLAAYLALNEAELTTPRTPSEHDPESSWSALDHLSHLGYIEETFVAMIRRHLAGEANPVALLVDTGGATRTREEIMADVHARTEADRVRSRPEQLGDVIRRTGAARAATLALLAELSDEQLDETLPGAPWADGTIGGVLATNAHHATMHWTWLKDAGAATR